MVTDEKKLQFAKFQHDLFERVVVRGSLDADEVMNVIRPLIGQGAPSKNRSLRALGVYSVPALVADVNEFFSQWNIIMTPSFKELIKDAATDKVYCNAHRIRVFQLEEEMSNDEITSSITGSIMYQTREEYLASIISRYKLWDSATSQHGFRKVGADNVDFVNTENGHLVVGITFEGNNTLRFTCDKYSGCGRWRAWSHVSRLLKK